MSCYLNFNFLILTLLMPPRTHSKIFYSTYKKLESRFTAQRDALKGKLPEIETTLAAVEHVKSTVRSPRSYLI